MNSLFGDTVAAPRMLVAGQRGALRARIEAGLNQLRALSQTQQRRLYKAARDKGPVLFALLGRLAADPLVQPLVQCAVERTRLAPTQAELNRAGGRMFLGSFRAGLCGFRPAASRVLRLMSEEYGEHNVARVTLAGLQRAYLAGSARSSEGGFDSVAVVMACASVAELRGADGATPGAQHGARDAYVAGAATSEKAAQNKNEVAGAERGVWAEQGILATGVLAACFHIEAGTRDFGEFADAMVADLGDASRPHLRMFYEAIRHYPGVDLSDRRAVVGDADRAPGLSAISPAR